MLRLSISQIQLLDKCEAAWHFRYVLKTPPDYVDTTALAFGRLYHHLFQCGLEAEVPPDLLQGLSEEAIAQAYACAVASIAEWRRYNLTIIANEIEVTENFHICDMVGYVDCVAVDTARKLWYVVELKTARARSDKQRLVCDPQINFYVSQHKKIVEKLPELNSYNFGGVIYREVIKPYKKLKDGETAQDYAKRVAPEIVSTSTLVAHADVDFVYKYIWTAAEKAQRILAGREPRRCYMRTACFAYERPCEYYSQCYGGSRADVISMQDHQRALEEFEF